jgi:hypothetical protein
MRIKSLASVLLGAAALLAPFSDAKGGAAPNPFAGKFIGNVPADFGSYFIGVPWSITIKGGGKFTGEKFYSGPVLVSGSLTGTVGSDGRMSISGTHWWSAYGSSSVQNFSYTASATVNSDGDLVVAFDTGETFVWARQ